MGTSRQRAPTLPFADSDSASNAPGTLPCRLTALTISLYDASSHCDVVAGSSTASDSDANWWGGTTKKKQEHEKNAVVRVSHSRQCHTYVREQEHARSKHVNQHSIDGAPGSGTDAGRTSARASTVAGSQS